MESAKCEASIRLTPVIYDKSQSELYENPTIHIPTPPILCPCCNSVMTPKHECQNTLPPDPGTPPNDTPAVIPCPPELINYPETSEGWRRLMDDPDFQDRVNAYGEAGGCATQ